MSSQTTPAELAALRAAGYCGADHPESGATCTRRPNHQGEHVNFYRGRQSPADTEGYRWPNSSGS